MPRIRSIHPEACESEKLLLLSDGAERTYWRLMTHSDDAGRGVDKPKLLASRLYPVDDAKTADVLDGHLNELVEAGLLVRYVVAGKPYYEIHDFGDWQKPRHPTESKLPSPEESDGHPTAKRRSSTDVRPDPPHGDGVGDGVGDGEGDNPIVEQAPPASTSLVLVPEVVQPDPVRIVFDEWQRSTGKTKARLDDKRRKAIKRALADYPLPDVVAAVWGWHESPHHRGENDRNTVYNDLDLLLRDAKRIEQFRDLASGERGMTTSPKAKGMAGIQAFARNRGLLEEGGR